LFPSVAIHRRKSAGLDDTQPWVETVAQ